MHVHPFARRETSASKGDYGAGRALVGRQLSGRLEIEYLVPQRDLGLADLTPDSEWQSARLRVYRNAHCSAVLKRTARIGRERTECLTAAFFANEHLEGIVVGPAVADERHQAPGSSGVGAQLQRRQE